MITERSVSIPAQEVNLFGNLTIPEGLQGLVIFAHGSGSSRLSPRNVYVANCLNEIKLATLLFDLLTEEEDSVYHNRFDINLLATRLVWATKWARDQVELRGLSVGYFGASTGAAAALTAAAFLGDEIDAVVSRGGRADMAEECIERVRAPVLLIVGGQDAVVLDLNEQAYEKLTAPKRLVTVSGATHLFEEPGALEEVARIAGEWFLQYLAPPKLREKAA